MVLSSLLLVLEASIFCWYRDCRSILWAV